MTPDFIQWLPSGRPDKASYEKSWTRFITGGGKVTSVAAYLHYSTAPKRKAL
ncbi:MAG: hypothetical protein ACRD2I_22655 [Vicinamibacterales bacterium]